MKAVLRRLAPDVPAVDIMHDAPVWNPRAAAYLLAALAQESDVGDVWLCVVDPGVGGSRIPVMFDCGGVTFVGPNNGLFELIRRRIPDSRLTRIDWRPERLSATFHGRDLFAPVAAMIARGDPVPCSDLPLTSDRPGADWPDSLAEVIYVDAYGNLITGLAGSTLQDGQSLRVGSQTMGFARTFRMCRPEACSGTETLAALSRSPPIRRGRSICSTSFKERSCKWCEGVKVVPMRRLELRTYALRMHCSTN